MIGHELREFVDRVMDSHAIDDRDVNILQRDVLADQITTRDTIDVLVALERAVPHHCSAFSDFWWPLVVDFAVWESRPTGVIDREKAHWLVTTLSAGEGPTPLAQRIAFELVREAQSSDEALLGFALRKGAPKVMAFSADRMLLAS